MTDADIIQIIKRVQATPCLTPVQRAEAMWLAVVFGATGVPELREKVDPADSAVCKRAHPDATAPVGSLEWHCGRWDAVAFGWPARSGIGLEGALLFALGEAEQLRADIDAMRAAGRMVAQWFWSRQATASAPKSTLN